MTAGLSTGFHTLYYRFKYNRNRWGHAIGRPVYLFATTLAKARGIRRGEYYFDTDPGAGKGINFPINNTSWSVDSATASVVNGCVLQTKNLTAGKHAVFVRLLDSANHWGHAKVDSFIHCKTSNPTVANNERCGAGTVVLTATGGTVGNYRWYLTP